LSEGKGWMYEGGTREPLIIKWPNIIKQNTICDVPVTSPDFFPTFLDIASIECGDVDGVSLLPLLRGEKSIDRDAIFWHYPHYGNQGGTPGSSVRAGKYKLIEFFEDNHVELYDLERDISEENDLAEDLPEKAAELRKLLIKWREKVEAKIPKVNSNYQ